MSGWLALWPVVLIELISAAICVLIARRNGDPRLVWAWFGVSGPLGIFLTAVLVRTTGARTRRDAYLRRRGPTTPER